MGILRDFFFGPSDESIAEDYLRSGCDEGYTPGSIRHYCVSEVADDIERQTGRRLTDHQTANVMQRIRNDYGLGPIADYNQPGYVDPNDDESDQADQREYNAGRAERDSEIEQEQSKGFWGWLLG